MGELSPDAPQSAADTLTCRDCGAPNPVAGRFCEACGAPLVGAQPDDGAAPGSRTRGAVDESRRRRAAERELGVQHLMKSARDTVAGLRTWLAVLTIATSLFALLIPVPLGQAIVLGLAATFGLGAWLAPKAPLQWIIGLAGLQTLIVALLLLLRGSLFWFHLLVTCSLWATVPRIARAQRVVREHPELFGSDAFVSVPAQLRRDLRARGDGDPRGEVVGRSQARRRASRKGSRQSVLLIASAIAMIAVAGVLGYRAIAAGESIDARVARFHAEWNADHHDVLAAMMDPEQRATFWPRVERLLQREGWDTDLPDLGEPDFVERHEQRAEVHFAITDRPGAVVRTYWNLEGTLWKVYTLRFTGLRD